jgi:hypothetical protein
MPIIKIYGCKNSDLLKNKKTATVPDPHGRAAMREKVRESEKASFDFVYFR